MRLVSDLEETLATLREEVGRQLQNYQNQLGLVSKLKEDLANAERLLHKMEGAHETLHNMIAWLEKKSPAPPVKEGPDTPKPTDAE